MENLSAALKHVSQAVDLDSNGFQQAAFSKYIQSLQVLIFYLNNIFASSGFKKMLDQKKEITQVLSMIHDCSDRISVILQDYGKPSNASVASRPYRQITSSEYHSSASKISAYDNFQKENMQLLKLYKIRLERAKDKSTKTNVTLEFHRRLAENAVLAKSKYDLAAKKMQKERVQLMENAIRKLFENNEQLSEKEKEKRQLYEKVLEYVKTETWPSSLKLNSFDLTTLETAEKVFNKILRCCEHPLTQWLILVQTTVKRKIDDILKQYHEYVIYFPDFSTHTEPNYSMEEYDKYLVIKCLQSEVKISLDKMLLLEYSLETISSEIRNIIENAVEIFYLIYKSLLPDESEAACYHIIEKYFLKPLWSNLFTLYRILNLPIEYRISENICFYETSTPAQFGIASSVNITDICRGCIALLKTIQQYDSIINKLKILVQVSQKICEYETVHDNCQRNLGTDEMIPVLCYVIVQSKLPELISISHMLECLFDMSYMLGEEGFALSSFQTALKCIEIKKLTEYDNEEKT